MAAPYAIPSLYASTGPGFSAGGDLMIEDIKRFISAEGQHPVEGLQIDYGMRNDRDEYGARIYCEGCERAWETSTSTVVLSRMSGMEVVHKVWVPFFKQVARTLCYKMSLVAEMAEWMTTRVAAAEPYGLKFSALTAEAAEFHLCDWRDVDTVLRTLGFDVEYPAEVTERAEKTIEVAMIGGILVNDPWVRLPAGHPLRKEQ